MPPERRHRISPGLVFIQALLGLSSHLFFVLPYMRKVHGRKNLCQGQRYLFVVNHVSLLDTILFGALCWRSGFYPILVLGDKEVWHDSWVKRFLSHNIGFLLQRRKLNPNRILELEQFGRLGNEFQLVVFPEGTRGDGINVQPCQPGIHYIAREAKLPIMPVFIENMHLVSTKHGSFHPLGGLRKIEVHFGRAIAPEQYLSLDREEFLEFVRSSIASARLTAKNNSEVADAEKVYG